MHKFAASSAFVRVAIYLSWAGSGLVALFGLLSGLQSKQLLAGLIIAAVALVAGAFSHAMLAAVLAIFDIANDSDALVDEAKRQSALLQNIVKNRAA